MSTFDTTREKNNHNLPSKFTTASVYPETQEKNVPIKSTHGISWITAAIFIVADTMGAGMISLPIALGNSGLVAGVIIIILASLTTGYTGIQLGENWENMQNRWPIYRRHCRRPYPEMAYRAHGAVFRAVVSVMLCASQFLVCSVLILMSAQNITNLLHTLFDVRLDACVFIVIVGLVVWPLTMPQSPMDFWQLAVISAASSTIAAGLIVFGSAHDIPKCLPERQMPSLGLKSISLSYGTIAFAYGGHATFPTIQHDMRKPHQFNYSVIASYIVTTAAYLAIAVIGLVTYGNSMMGTIIPSIQLTWVAQTINVLITAHILPTIIIVFSPIAQQFEDYVKIPNKFSLKRFLLRTALIALMTFTALSVLRLDVFLNLIGGTTVTMLTMVLPSVFWLYLTASRLKRNHLISDGKIQKDSPDDDRASVYDIFQYVPKTILAINGFCIIFGLLGGISATYGAVEGFIGSQQLAPCYVKWFRDGFLATSHGGSVHCCGHYRNISVYDKIERCANLMN